MKQNKTPPKSRAKAPGTASSPRRKRTTGVASRPAKSAPKAPAAPPNQAAFLSVSSEIVREIGTANLKIKRKILVRECRQKADALWTQHLFSKGDLKGRKAVKKATSTLIAAALDCRETLDREVRMKKTKTVKKPAGKANTATAKS